MTPIESAWRRRLLFGVCLCLLAGILVAGLWPFTPWPHNDVSWIANQNGLLFGDYGSILSSAPLPLDGPPDGSCSIELWSQPGLIDDSNTMLAFQTPESPLRFRIEQNGKALRFDRQETGRYAREGSEHIWMADVLRPDTPILVTVTAGAGGTAVYLNGELARSAPEFHLVRRDLTGGIVVANSAVINDSWAGVLRGIGIYNQELSPAQVRRNYEDWTRWGRPSALEETKAAAVYPFTERSGKVVHSLVTAGADLYIPDYYVVLYPPFLQPFWTHWGWNWAFWKDGLINIFGFMPLGFFFCLYFAQSKPLGRAILLTCIFGCAISFVIEATQFYLPTRDSDSMDFINNTLGTALGAMCCLPHFVQSLLARLGMAPIRKWHLDATPAPMGAEPAIKQS